MVGIFPSTRLDFPVSKHLAYLSNIEKMTSETVGMYLLRKLTTTEEVTFQILDAIFADRLELPRAKCFRLLKCAKDGCERNWLVWKTGIPPSLIVLGVCSLL